ncbi:hypothetical protein WOC76_12625 [Methylocystis sp. IM3]|uniref:hypothetical protein n=1 Tax=unclassified Methylocystis TaxID=2625913 RepID=UPI0030F70C01
MAMTPEDLKNARAAARAEYAAALDRLRQAYVSLSAIDQAAQNGNVRYCEFIRTFFSPPRAEERKYFTHPDFAPDPLHDWADEINVRREELLRALGA